jgi:GGDEF domain-containing protein
VLCEDTPPHLADTITARLRHAAAHPFDLNGVIVTLSASVGHCPVRGKNATDVLREADERMYEAKRCGRSTARRS